MSNKVVERSYHERNCYDGKQASNELQKSVDAEATSPARLIRRSFIWALVALTCVSGVSDLCNASEPATAGIVFFEKEVRSLLVKHCYECHSGKEVKGGLRLDTRDAVLRGGDSGAAIVPGDPENSRLIAAVRYKDADLQMPPEIQLSLSEIATLEKWVLIGAPDPRIETIRRRNAEAHRHEH